MRSRVPSPPALFVSTSLALCLLAAALAACGDDGGGGASPGPSDAASPQPDAGADGAVPPRDSGIDADASVATYTIGGTVTGLAPTTGDAGLADPGAGGLVLQNGAEKIRVNANGSFTFATKVPANGSYDVTIAEQPTNPAHTCTVSGGKGTVVAGNIATVTVNCSIDTFTVGGHVTGLAGSGLQLRIDDRENVDINVNDGTYAFPTVLPSGASYSVVVNANPTNRWQTCTIANATGVIADGDVADVDVTCADNTYTVSGTISGLTAAGLVLTNTYSGGGGPENVSPPIDATSFTFTQGVRSGESYAVTLGVVPATLRCVIANGSGTVAGVNITGVSVTCSPKVFDFAFTGGEQIYTVPAWATSLDVTLDGAQGGTDFATSMNYGGRVTAKLSVSPGEQLSLFVGGQPSDTSGGFNGGGAGENSGRGGGGATDIRRGGNTLAHRILVAAGGGGGGVWTLQNLEVVGGAGGGLTGETGRRESDVGGQGGTQTSSGTGTCFVVGTSTLVSGGFGFGGTPAGHSCGCMGYGGGGGWWGGAGSGNCRGGGGGSSYIADDPSIGSASTTTGGAEPGNGSIHIVVN